MEVRGWDAVGEGPQAVWEGVWEGEQDRITVDIQRLACMVTIPICLWLLLCSCAPHACVGPHDLSIVNAFGIAAKEAWVGTDREEPVPPMHASTGLATLGWQPYDPVRLKIVNAFANAAKEASVRDREKSMEGAN